jgi:hypothetical protein
VHAGKAVIHLDRRPKTQFPHGDRCRQPAYSAADHQDFAFSHDIRSATATLTRLQVVGGCPLTSCGGRSIRDARPFACRWKGGLRFRSSGRGDQPIYQYRDGTGQQSGASHGHGVADRSQTILVDADPKCFFVPLYAGHKGWIGMRLDNKVDWREVAEIAKRSCRMTASKKLAELLQPMLAAPAQEAVRKKPTPHGKRR